MEEWAAPLNDEPRGCRIDEGGPAPVLRRVGVDADLGEGRHDVRVERRVPERP